MTTKKNRFIPNPLRYDENRIEDEEIPAYREQIPDTTSEDRDSKLFDSNKIAAIEERKRRLFTESNIGRERVCGLLDYNDYNIGRSNKELKNLVIPDLFPDAEKTIFRTIRYGEKYDVKRFCNNNKSKIKYDAYKVNFMGRVLKSQRIKDRMEYYTRNKRKDRYSFKRMNKMKMANNENAEMVPMERNRPLDSELLENDTGDTSSLTNGPNTININEGSTESTRTPSPGHRNGRNVRNSYSAVSSSTQKTQREERIQRRLKSTEEKVIREDQDLVEQEVDGDALPLRQADASSSVSTPSRVKRSITWSEEQVTVIKYCLPRFGPDFNRIAAVIGDERTAKDIKRFLEISNYFGIIPPPEEEQQ